ncbi:MAG: LLM class flavin-dependent oxidoreductase [Actinomycetota bacterium]|nr:LLM class flavin-dependent oxidoreductase [Actinomycetota bacterium]
MLDQSPIASGSTAAEAVRDTVALAQAAERLGYRRYWLAEHHNSASLAGSTPEVLIAHVAAATSSIRVGAGGVMLSHYSALKVAENFRMLHTLFPDRIDLGVGRTAGTDDPATATALQHGPEPLPLDRFPVRLRDLIGFLEASLDGEHPLSGVRAVPEGPGAPDVWVLGSSSTSAAYAADLGLRFSFAHFITPFAGSQVVGAYRRHFRPSATLAQPEANVAVSVLCAETDAEAERLASSARLARVRPGGSDAGPIPSVEEAEAYPYTELQRALLAQDRPRAIVGAPDRARARMLALAERFGVEELVVVTVCHDPKARLRSYELLAEAFALDGTGARPA